MFDLYQAHKQARPKRKRREPEAFEQKALIKWARRTTIAGYLVGEYLTHVPNEGKRGPKARSDFYYLGGSPGYPDLMLDIPVAPFHGLRIEMKRPDGGTVKENQRDWHRKLNQQGYLTVVCHSCDEAKDIITKYLTGKINEQNRDNHATA